MLFDCYLKHPTLDFGLTKQKSKIKEFNRLETKPSRPSV